MSDQKNWDAAVIKTWRNAGSVLDAMILFTALSGKDALNCDPPLKRIPPTPYPWKLGIRIFVANHLSKISKRLWEQTPDKDILLLRKLETSSYDTEKDRIEDLELARERGQDYRNRKKVAMSVLEHSNRNQATDWNVTKGPSRIRMKR
jgi:hypothetical protein